MNKFINLTLVFVLFVLSFSFFSHVGWGQDTKPDDVSHVNAVAVNKICLATDPADLLVALKSLRRTIENGQSTKIALSNDDESRLIIRLRDLLESPKVLGIEFPKTWDQVKNNNSLDTVIEIRDEAILILEEFYPTTYADVVKKWRSINNPSIVMVSIVGNIETKHARKTNEEMQIPITINGLDKNGGLIIFENLMKSDDDQVRAQVVTSFCQYATKNPSISNDQKFRDFALNVFKSDKFDNVKIIILRVLVNWSRDDKSILTFLQNQAVSDTQSDKVKRSIQQVLDAR